MSLLAERAIARSCDLDQLTSTHTATVANWAGAYRRRGPASRSPIGCQLIAIYQLGQAQRWARQPASLSGCTVAESVASSVLWWLMCADHLALPLCSALPYDLRDIASGRMDYDIHHVFLGHACQQLNYAVMPGFAGRSSRYQPATLTCAIASLIRSSLRLVPSDRRAAGFADASAILLGRG
jgi:hypothetical protein